ncbi:MAG: hypothetical protein HZA54_20990 [Planctomycetes bacterium]|nr:hypothetical protein [Planctomycetota bacterium]
MIWELHADPNRDIVLRTAIDYFQTHFVGERIGLGWRPPPIRVQGGTKKRLRDFVSWMSSAPVLSEKSRSALLPLIGEHCEFLPLITLRGKPYYALNVLTTIKKCLNHRASDILYSPEDPKRILQISAYHFYEDRIPSDTPAFKIPEDAGCVFVTESFVDAVIVSGLRGASFHDPAANTFGKLARGETLNVVPGLPE